MFSRINTVLSAPVDFASLAAFRIGFGLLLFFASLRSLLSDWLHVAYVQPTFFFKYPGFAWIDALPLWGMELVYIVMALSALGIALGWFYRTSALVFMAAFSYAHFIDVTNYLNHYYLVTLLVALMVFMPLDEIASVTTWRKPWRSRSHGPGWCLWLLRFQIAIVYFYAGLAKFGSDWLLHAQPLGIWLSARTDTPLIGAWLDERWVAFAMSWTGFAYDMTIVFWLSWRKSRPFAYAAVLVFHALTHVFFNIGLFPFVMTLATTLFFDPSWPRRFNRRWSAILASAAQPQRPQAYTLQSPALTMMGAYVLLQLLLPLRHHFYPGDVLWNELGMRFSWKVMVREKSGSVRYRVEALHSDRRWELSPARYLTARQEMEMSGQPDLIAQLARHIRHDFAQKGWGPVAVYADTWVSLNGRRPSALINPEFDLATVSPFDVSADWLLPRPSAPPLTIAQR